MAKNVPIRSKLKALISGKRPFSGRLLLALFPSLGIGFTLFFFGPLDLSYISRNYISYSPWNILPLMGLITAAVFLVLLLAASVIGGKTHAFLVSVYTGLLLGFYIQGAFLNPDFGTMDGHAVNWPSFSTSMLINLAVWFVILLIPHLIHYFSNRAWRAFVIWVPLALILMQSVSLGVKLADQMKYDRQKSGNYYISTENMLKPGKVSNIAVFLLDTVSNADVDVMLKKYPETFALFHDFTRYDNANTRYMFTVPSLVSILTGEEYDCENVRIADYLNDAWKSDEALYAYDELAAKGYERNIYALMSEIVKDPSVLTGTFSNMKFSSDEFSVDRRGVLNLIKLSFYRYFPLTMKPYFVIYTTEISNLVTWNKNALQSEWDFVDMMNANHLTPGSSDNAFSFYYLAGTHLPYRMDERGRMIQSNLAPEYFTNYTDKEDQLAGFFYLIENYLRELKSLGLYDQTGIIILADHGANQDREADHQPVYFIRMPGEFHDEMQVRSAPITIQESFLSDVLSMIGSDPAPAGIPSAEVPDEPAERWTRVYAIDGSYPELEGSVFNVMREYKYDGDGQRLIEKWTEGVFDTILMKDSYY